MTLARDRKAPRTGVGPGQVREIAFPKCRSLCTDAHVHVTIPDPVHDSPGERHGCVWSPRAASLLFWVRKISLPMQKRGSPGASWWHHRPHGIVLCFSDLTGEIIGEACRDPGLLSSSTSPSSLLPLLSIKPLGRPLLCHPPSSFLQLAPSLPGSLVHRRLCLFTLTLPLSAPLRPPQNGHPRAC